MIVRPNSRQAWISLAWGGVFFALVAAVTQFALPSRMERFRDPPYMFRRDRMQQRFAAMRAEQAPGEPEIPLVITLGSSRMMNAIDGKTTEQMLEQRLGKKVCIANFGTPGFGPLHSLTLLGRMLRDGVKPDLVVIDVLPSYFNASWGNQLPPDNWLPIMSEDQAWLAERGFDVKVTQQDRKGLAIYGYRTELIKSSPVRKMLPRHMLNQWVTRSDPWGTDVVASCNPDWAAKALGYTKNAYADAMGRFSVGEEGLKVLRTLLNECREHKIDTAVVLMPEGTEFRSWYRPGAREEFEVALTGVTRECGSTLIVGSEWIDDADFVDSHHLLFAGATKFSERLTKEALEPLLEGRTEVAARSNQGPLRR
jgi:hypothetical protein